MIKALIFDIGGILYESGIFGKEHLRVLKKFGINLSFKELKKIWKSVKLDAEIGKETRRQAANRFLLKVGISEDRLKEYWQEFSKPQYRVERKLYPEVKETLAKLKDKGLKIVFLSDTTRKYNALKKILEEQEIYQFADSLVCSSEIGHMKPDKEAFQYALDSVGVDKSEALFVGHAEDEVEGAKEFGLKTIGFNCDKGVSGDYDINIFSEILNVVGDQNGWTKSRNNEED